MKNRLFAILLLTVLSSGSLSAITVTVNFANPDPDLDLLETEIKTQVENTIGKYDAMPDFARGFGNANTYSSHAATLRGYQGYSIFAAAVGTMISIQAPNEDPLFIMKLQDELDDGDMYAGLGLTPVAIQGGVNLSFIIDDLYLSFKIGRLNFPFDYASYEIDYRSEILGVFLNYQILEEKSILSRILLWRGVSIESGVIYSSSDIKFFKELDPITGVTAVAGPFTVTADVDPSVEFELSTVSYIVPVEFYTSIRLLYFLNIGVGGGVDFVAAGDTDITLLSDGGATITDDGAAGLSGFVGEEAAISVDASTNDVEADWYRTKLMANIGLGFGPVFIDLPLTYYFTDNGYSLGISAGMVW